MLNVDGTNSAMRSSIQSRANALVESASDAFISRDLDGRIETWNPGAERIFGYTAAEMIGQSVNRLAPPDRQEEEKKIVERLRAGERVDPIETIRKRKDGREIHVSIAFSAISDEDRITGIAQIAREITAQKQLETELRKAKEAAEDASKAKNLFISILSHELRTPLTPALAILSSLETSPDLPAEAREQIKMVRRNIEIEAGLVDDLLDLTRASGGKVTLHFETVNAHEALRQCVGGLQRGIQEKSLKVTLTLKAKKHHVWADPRRLQQIFFNLISNAVKFTPVGGEITVRSSDADDKLQIQVVDNGAGIEPELLPKIFRAFEQAPESRRFGGLGLGLSIVKSLLTMHGGTVTAESEGRGTGSIFTVELLTADNPASAKTKSRRGEQEAKSYRLLLVEDHADTLSALTTLLKRKGYAVTPAASVAEALLAAESANFDLLLSDMGLPDGTGSDIIRYLKTRGNIRGIALTGFGQDEDITNARAAGFDTHITKPIKIQVLHETILKTMAAAGGQPAIAS
jgi:PAS domain S-box-containing protein